jgi:hypothetical protein
MGGVYQHVPPAGEWVAWMGGKPLLDWSGLESNWEALTPMMYRMTAGKDTKRYQHRIKGLTTKFNSTDNLRAFCRTVMKHLCQCGMDSITYLPDPANPTEMESIVENPNKFTKEYVMTKIALYEAKYDSYDRENARSATDFVIDSLSPNLEHRVSEALRTATNPGFLLTWMTLLEKIRILSHVLIFWKRRLSHVNQQITLVRTLI